MSANLQQATSKVQLEVILPDVCVLRWHHAVLCATFTVLFLYFSYLPVSGLQTWNAVASGLFGSNTSEFIPLSAGIRHIEIAWASQSAATQIYQYGGAECLSFVFATLQTLTLICWSVIFHRLTKRWWSMFAVVAVFIAGQPLASGFSSDTLGQFALALFMALMTRQIVSKQGESNANTFRWSLAGRLDWIFVAGLFMVWANLSVSFVLGLGWLIGMVVARCISVSQEQGLRFAWTDRELQSRIWLLELAIVATAINPQGIGLWSTLLWWPDNPIAHAFGGWNPTVLASWNGMLVVAAWAAIVTVSRRRAIAAIWWIQAVALTLAVAVCQPFIIWFAPLILCTLFAMIGECQSAQTNASTASSEKEQGSLRFAYSLASLLVLWVGFSFCPWGSLLLGGKSRNEKQLVSDRLPLALRDYLQQHPSNGMLLCPVTWSDWLQVETATPMFLNANSHLVPSSVVDDYQQMQRGAANWQSIAEKYALTKIVIDKQGMRQWVRRVRQTPGSWKIAYEDSQAILLTSN